MTASWKDDIFKQKGLWDVYLLSRRALPRSRQNKWITTFIAFFLVFIFIATILETPKLYKARYALQFMNFVSGQSFTFCLGILGFLITGFAVFASITKVDVFISLAKRAYKKSPEINNLQYIFFNFLNVFSIYIGLLALSLSAEFVSADSSPLIRLIPNSAHQYQKVWVAVGGGISFIICLWTAIAILRLKSFIWNLYQTVLLAIAMEDEMKQKVETNR
jgi:hypothetical protein